MLLIPVPKASGCLKDRHAGSPFSDTVKKWAL